THGITFLPLFAKNSVIKKARPVIITITGRTRSLLRPGLQGIPPRTAIRGGVPAAFCVLRYTVLRTSILFSGSRRTMLILIGMEGNVKRKMAQNFRPVHDPQNAHAAAGVLRRPPYWATGHTPAQIPNSSQM